MAAMAAAPQLTISGHQPWPEGIERRCTNPIASNIGAASQLALECSSEVPCFTSYIFGTDALSIASWLVSALLKESAEYAQTATLCPGGSPAPTQHRKESMQAGSLHSASATRWSRVQESSL